MSEFYRPIKNYECIILGRVFLGFPVFDEFYSPIEEIDSGNLVNYV